MDATFSGERLRQFYIRVGNVFDEDNFDPFTYDECWYQSDQLANAETREFTCHQVLLGRYVAIHHSLNVSLVLTLCEVQVYSDLGNEYIVYKCLKRDVVNVFRFASDISVSQTHIV